jgi:hypothetical protein
MTEVRDVGDLDIMRECSALSSVRLLDYYGLCGSRTWGCVGSRWLVVVDWLVGADGSEERVLGVGMLWVAEGRGSGDKAVAV